eukprot:5809706-Amphidinium_carterae.3
MSKRKTAAVKSWENILKSGEPQRQIDAAERLMQQPWVLPMPVLPSNPWIEPEGRWCEAVVLGVYWNTGPGTPVNKLIVAVPDAAGDREEAVVEVMANLYLPAAGPETSEPVEEVLVRVVILPGDFLVKRLSEAIPRDEPLVTFSEAHPSAMPAGGQVFPVVPEFEEFQKGVMVSLIEDTDGKDELCVTYGQESLLEEVYHSTGEMDFNELQSALLPVAAASTTRRRPAASEKAESVLFGPPGGRRGARVVNAASEGPAATGARPKMRVRPESQASEAPPGLSELMAAIGTLTDRVNSLSEQREAPLASGAGAASLLDAGRVPAPGLAGVMSNARASLGGRLDSAGATAYDRTLATARRMLGEASERLVAQEAAGAARARSSEEAWREAAAESK